MMITAAIQIGNSDNKLTQDEWAHFVSYMDHAIKEIVYRVHFFGGSATYDPWQNVCWVVEVKADWKDALCAAVTKVRASHNQDSAAIVFGETKLI